MLGFSSGLWESDPDILSIHAVNHPSPDDTEHFLPDIVEEAEDGKFVPSKTKKRRALKKDSFQKEKKKSGIRRAISRTRVVGTILVLLISVIIAAIIVWATGVQEHNTLKWIFGCAVVAGIGFAILFNLWIVPKKDKEEKKERADLFLCVKLKSELMFNAIRKYVASLSDFQFLQDGGVLVGNTLIPESKYKVEVVSDEEHMPSKGRWVVFDIASHDETGAEDIRLCKEIAIVSPRVPGWYTVHPISTHGKKVANSCSLQYDLKIQRRSQYMALMLLLASIGEYDLLEFYIKSCASAVCCGANNTIPSVFKSRMEWKNICSDQERWKITEKMHLYAEHMNLDEQSLSFLAALEAMEEKPVYLGARVKDIIKRRYYRMQADIAGISGPGFPWSVLDLSLAERIGIRDNNFSRRIDVCFDGLSLLEDGIAYTPGQHSYGAGEEDAFVGESQDESILSSSDIGDEQEGSISVVSGSSEEEGTTTDTSSVVSERCSSDVGGQDFFVEEENREYREEEEESQDFSDIAESEGEGISVVPSSNDNVSVVNAKMDVGNDLVPEVNCSR